MNKYERLISHLPSLYRPEADEESLFNLLLKEIGDNLDQLSRDLTLVMQAHWFKTADKASLDPHFQRARELAGKTPVNLHDPEERRLVDEYPYLLDLARLGSLVSIAPRREPAALRETVEQYRLRLQRIMTIYRNGLGTLNALRQMVSAELPEDLSLPLPARKRSFCLEENAPFIGPFKDVQSLGLPIDQIGPLMRWQLANSGLKSVAPVVYIEGLSANDDLDATTRPMIERFNESGPLSDQGGLVGIGIAYLGTVPPGRILKLQPGYRACLSGDSGIFLSSVQATQTGIKGWQPVAGAPPGLVRAVLQTSDKMLWLAINNGGSEQLWRYNGSAWLQVLATEPLPEIHCLHERRGRLLIGHDEGLAMVDLYPQQKDNYTLSPIAAYTGQAVFCCSARRSDPQQFYIGAADGLSILGEDDTVVETLLSGTVIRAVAENDISLYCGGDLGVIQYQCRSGRLFYLSGEFESEQEDDWLPFAKDNLPDTPPFGLPTVHALHIADNGTLWIGTASGLARYRARNEGDLVYRVLLEGFIDLIDGKVSQISKDEHGFLWFTTNRGLLRYDGRDLARWNMTDNVWQQLGEADVLYQEEQAGPRGVWRFQRELQRWESFDYSARKWAVFPTLPDLPEEPFDQLIFVDGVLAALGSLDGEQFTKTEDVDDSQLVMRCKPDHTRIIDGGLAALPRIPKGVSNWRYLSLEPEDLVDGTDLPWWSMEGRLVPPPDHDWPYPGRFHQLNMLPYRLDQMVFAYNPAAKISLQWANNKPLQVIVRLLQRNNDDIIDPAILDRIWKAINQVRPAGVQVLLAVEGDIVRGEIT